MAPRIDSLSNHQVSGQSSIFINGSGFQDVTGVQIGSDWAADYTVDGDTVITVTLPELAGGSTNWVIVHTADGESPCEGDAQLLTIAAPQDAPPSALRLDSITPETITLGNADKYWLQGGGLSHVSSVILGSSACTFESYDDTRLIVEVPEQVRDASDGASVELTVFAGNESATLSVTCNALPAAPDPADATMPPALTGVQPAQLGPDGGQIQVQGLHLSNVITVSLGNIECGVDSTSDREVSATVPSLADYVGQSLNVCVTDGTSASGETDILVTVTG